MRKAIIELTNDCNLTCPMCPRHHIDMEIGYMPMDLWRKLMGMIPTGSTILPFWRGESTLHPDFEEMIQDLRDYEVVLATNGTNPDSVIHVLDYLSAINVSIHNKESLDGYLKIKRHTNGGKPVVITSSVKGENILAETDRTYQQHTMDGVWGKVEGFDGLKNQRCDRLDDSVIAWNGTPGMCCYVWDTSNRLACSECSQWAGEGKTL